MSQLSRGEFPPRIGRDAVEFTTDGIDGLAASLETLELTNEETVARIDELSESIESLAARVESVERGARLRP